MTNYAKIANTLFNIAISMSFTLAAIHTIIVIFGLCTAPHSHLGHILTNILTGTACLMLKD